MTGKIKRVMPLSVVCLMLWLFSMSSALAKTPEIRIDVDDTKMNMGTTYTLTLSFMNMDKGQVSDIGIKGMDQFEMLSQSSSSSMSNINGVVTKENKLHIKIRPKKEGEIALQAVATYKRQQYTSNAISVTVTPQSKELLDEQRDVFVSTNLSKENIYFGESIVLTYELYTSYSIQNFGFIDAPKYENFLIREEKNYDDWKVSRVEIDGKQYLKYEISQVVLNPTGVGTFEIPSYDFRVVFQGNSMFGGGEVRDYKTDSKKITVNALPTANKPSNDKGFIGDYKITSGYSQTDLKVGESTTLTVNIEGEGNLTGFGELLKTSQENVTLYDSKVKDDTTMSKDGYKQSTTYEVIVIPNKAGELTLAFEPVSYFNVNSGKYEVLEIPEQVLQVIGDSVASGSTPSFPNVTERKSVVINRIQLPSSTGDYYQIKKEVAVGIIITLVIIVILIIVVILIKKAGMKGNLKPMFMYSCHDHEKLYDYFNESMKTVYSISPRAYSRSAITELIGDSQELEKVTGIMDIMEQKNKPSKEDVRELKKLIKQWVKLVNKRK